LPIAFSLGWEFENLWYRHRTDHRVGVHGALFHYNDTWQLIMNSSTTIITFPMVFLIQNTQNRDNYILHLKSRRNSLAIAMISALVLADLEGRCAPSLTSVQSCPFLLMW
jgi:hypothetical protein